jgi:molybdopterin converting factor small subunit
LRIVVECYGASSRWCGADRLNLDMPEQVTAKDTLQHLAERFPDLAARRDTLALALGDRIVPGTQLLAEGDHLALIPPVSGG